MTRRRVVPLAGLLATAFALPAPAQDAGAPETVRLTLAAAVEQARTHSPRLDQLRALQASAEADLRGAQAGRLPQVELSGGYTRNSNVPELVLALPGRPPQTVFPNIANTYRTRLAVSVPLYTGGAVSGSIDAARGALTAAGTDVSAGLNDLVLETITAYWALVSARESARVLAESIASYDADLKQVEDRFSVGMAARKRVYGSRPPGELFSISVPLKLPPPRKRSLLASETMRRV